VIRPLLLVAALAVALTAAGALGAVPVWGAFAASATSVGNTITAAADFTAPESSLTEIAKSAGGTPAFLKKGGAYFVYANVADSGNPASGVATVTANVSAITAGSTAVPLSAGTFTVDGETFNRRSASLSAGSALAEGALGYSLTMADAAGNSQTESGLSVTVDNKAPTATDVQAANGSTTVGLAQQGDTITFTYSEPPDPNSILAGWTGAATGVVVRLNNATNDTVTVFNAANTTQLNLGSVNLGRSDYTTTNRTFGASGTASSMVLSGSSVTIALGTQSGAASTAAGTGTMVWTPSSSATDRAGNAASTATASETGAADKEF
jgi:hypothetical protein